MELTSGQRKALFALIAAVLAALGIYMFVPAARAARGDSSPQAAAHSPARQTRPSAAPATSSPAPAAPTPSAVDIYQWLRLSQAALAGAAAVVTQFSDAYGTYSYSENAAAYVDSMRSLITPELSQVLEAGYSVPGVASQRASKKQVATGTAVISSLRAFRSPSMTFVVTITHEITDAAGRSQVTARYAGTLTAARTTRQLTAIPPTSPRHTRH